MAASISDLTATITDHIGAFQWNRHDANAPILLSFELLQVPVIIRDAREAWGRTDVLVSPAEGAGEQWVTVGRLSPA